MALAQLAPIPKRTAQGSKLTSNQHDYIHTLLHGGLSAVIDEVNQLVAGIIGSNPPGVSLVYRGVILPAGYLWEDGTEVSKTTYADLWAAFSNNGTQTSPWDTGTETTGYFRLPSPMARMEMCANPLNGQSAASPTLSARAIGAKGGAESYTNASVAVSGSTPEINFSPEITIPALSIANTVTATIDDAAITVNDTIAISAITASITNPSITVNNMLAVSPVTASLANGNIEVVVTETGGPTTINAQLISGLEINGVTCVGAPGEPGDGSISCGSTLTVEDFTPTISKTAITGAFQVTASLLDPAINVSGGALTGSVTASIANPTISVSGGTKSGTVTASITDANITIGGTLETSSTAITPSLTVPATALSGVTASINVPTIGPFIVSNRIIKY